MSAAWNAERVLALAPDPASAKAGQGLATARKWVKLGAGDGLLWGECQGSGKDPYQTKVDPHDDAPAFACSCPSHKFPCKHALGLFLIWVANPVAMAEGTPPAWASAWKEARAKKAEAKKEKAERGPTPVDTAAQAKREAARLAKVGAGLDDLALWLADLVRQGFAMLNAKSSTLLEDQARRMVDAQAPGLARRLRQIDDMSRAVDGWQVALLDRLAQLHLAIEGYRRRESLAPEVAADLLTTIGFPADLDAARQGTGIRDHWQVIGQAIAAEEQVTTRRTWLVGRETGRPALLLDFAAGGRPLEPGPSPGTVLDADLAFFPGALALRALIQQRHAPPAELHALPIASTIAVALAAYGEALARSPWVELTPAVIADAHLQRGDDSWSARDAEGSVVPLSRRFSAGWRILAISGGSPFALCGEFDGDTLDPLGALVDGRFVPLVDSQPRPTATPPVAPRAATPLLREAATSALIGVDRRPPPDPSPDGPIAAALRGLESRGPAARLLALAAAEGLRARAGRRPIHNPSACPDPCPPESRPECSPEAARRLRVLLTGEYEDLLPEWLGLLAAAGQRIPHNAIVDLLDREPHRGCPADLVIRAIGTRGRWLAAQNAPWRKFAGVQEDADPAAVWESGDRHQRLASLRALRATDPARAAALVASTFGSEPAEFRAAILDEYGPNSPDLRGLSMADEPFLESCLDDRGKQVRWLAAQLLRKLPDSRLSLRMIERARSLLSWNPARLLARRGTLVVQLPAACDPAMARDGITPKPEKEGKLGERAIWLREILAATPPAAIAAMLGATPAELVQAGRGHEWEAPLREAWIASATTHRDADWAEALLEAAIPDYPTTASRPRLDISLFTALPRPRREAFFARLLKIPGPFLASSYPAAILAGSLDRPLAPSIAHEMLARIRQLIDDERKEIAGRSKPASAGMRIHNYATDELIRGLGDALSVEMVDEAGAGFDPGDEPRPGYAVAYATMLDRLRFRRDLHREFAP